MSIGHGRVWVPFRVQLTYRPTAETPEWPSGVGSISGSANLCVGTIDLP